MRAKFGRGPTAVSEKKPGAQKTHTHTHTMTTNDAAAYTVYQILN